MNLILLFKNDFIENTNIVQLKGRRLQHVKSVHRAIVGDILTVGLENNKMGTGRITRIDNEILEMEIELKKQPPSATPINLVLALPRPKVISRVILSLCSMGIKNIWLINAKRVEKSYWQSPKITDANIKKQMILGLEQAKDTIMPTLIKKPFFKAFVEDELPCIIKDSYPIVAHPGTDNPCPKSLDRPITLAIGPEGGFIPYELEKLVECGFLPFHMGERILRVETAIPALIGRLCYR